MKKRSNATGFEPASATDHLALPCDALTVQLWKRLFQRVKKNRQIQKFVSGLTAEATTLPEALTLAQNNCKSVAGAFLLNTEQS